MKEIIKIREKINKMETKNNIKESKQQKTWFFEKNRQD
jgi:hypothetical protein